MSRIYRNGVLIFVLLLSGLRAFSNDGGLVIHLLGYLATDYRGAVADGKVINEFEYAEMVEFSHKIAEESSVLLAENNVDSNHAIYTRIAELSKAVNDKSSPEVIHDLAMSIRDHLVTLLSLQLYPDTWPVAENGKALFTLYCAPCHGTNGDGNGPQAEGLTPRPSNFRDVNLMSGKAAVQLYHSIRYGVDGTAMKSFPMFSPRELWDIAFYIEAISYNKETPLKNYKPISLDTLATYSDIEMKGHGMDDGRVSFSRLYSKIEKGSAILSKAESSLKEAKVLYGKGFSSQAEEYALAAYLDGIEPLELRLRAQDPALVQSLEITMANVRKSIAEGDSYDEVSHTIDLALAELQKAHNALEMSESGFWFILLLAASVILREGMEAFLVIIVFISILQKAEAKKALKYVHAGWISAVLIGLISWFFAGKLMNLAGAQREVMEGFASFIAVAFLFYIGFWMHSKSEAKKWNEFVKNRIHGLINSQSMIGLGFLSFIVVFREALESVLFLVTMNLEESNEQQMAIGIGVLVAFVLVIIASFLILKFSKRLPITELFKYSAIVVAMLTIVLMGKGAHALQEAGWISISSFPFLPRVGLLGVYPTVETFIAQLFMLSLSVLAWFYTRKLVSKAQ